MRPSDYPHGQGVAVATLLITAGQPQETRSASGEVLLARLTRPVFAQFADDGQRRFVVQIKREGFGLVLLGCGFRVHVYWVRALRLEERVRCRWCAGPQKQKAPKHCCFEALETPPPAVGQAMNDTVSRILARL